MRYLMLVTCLLSALVAAPPLNRAQAHDTENIMAKPIQIVGDDGGQLAAALQSIAGDWNQLQNIGAESPALAAALQGKQFRMVNAGDNFGLAQTICLPMVIAANGAVATGAAISLSGSPVRAFQPTRLIIGSTLPGVEVNTFVIGNTSQFLATTGSVPGEAFSALAVDESWEFTSCPGQTPCSVTGVNRNAATSTIFATILGKTTQA